MQAHWWEHCTAIKRYMPEKDGLSLQQIIEELDFVVESGYQAVQITAPYESAGFSPWWGLRPADYFQINRSLGTSVEEFYLLTEQCHQRGLKIIAFLNLGYADVTSVLWKKACRDVQLGVDSPERQYFLWSRTGRDVLQQPGTMHFRQGGGWIWSAAAQCYYWCFWNRDGYAEPQYDWSSPAFRDYAGRVLRFWMNTGLDGVILDAVNWYLNCDWKTIRTYAVNVIHSYPDALCIPEGGGGFQDDPVSWIVHGGFDVIENQRFESDLHWNGSAVMDAILSGDPSQLEARLDVHDGVRSCGNCTWSYLSWGSAWTMPRRLLEIAVLIGTGHMTEIIPSYLADASPEETEKLRQILQASCHPGLAPVRSRLQLSTANDQQYYAVLRSREYHPVLCVYNFQNETRTISVLFNNNIPAHSVLRDLLEGTVYGITECHLTVTLPPLGFGFYAVDKEL